MFLLLLVFELESFSVKTSQVPAPTLPPAQMTVRWLAGDTAGSGSLADRRLAWRQSVSWRRPAASAHYMGKLKNPGAIGGATV